MQQPKQQRTYADLYSQQRPASTSPAPQEGTRPAQQSSNGRSGAAVAAGSVCSSRIAASEHRTSPGAAAAAMKSSSSPPKAFPDGLTAHKPSRIPVHPGKSPSSSPAVISSAGGAAAAAQHARDASPPAAVSRAAAAHGHSNGRVAASNGTCTVTSTTQQAALTEQLRSATMGDSSDWSQDSSSTTSSDISSLSPSKHSRSRHASRTQDSIQGDFAPEQQHADTTNGTQQQQSSRHSGNGVQDMAQDVQQQQAGSVLDSLPQGQQQQSHSVERHSQRQEQQRQQAEQQQLEDVQPQMQQRQQQQSHANGSPGPPAMRAGAAIAAGAAAAAAGASCPDSAGSAHGAASCSAAPAAAAVIDSDVVRARMSADPDYELPQGKLTETQVLLAHGSKLRLDRYGFILGESDMAGRTVGAAAAAGPRPQRSTSQVQREQRRVAKWRHMLGSSATDFEAYCKDKMKKVKRRVRKGIPDEFRGYAWQLLSGGHALLRSHPGMYARLVSHSPDAVDLEIMRDLNRTFPNHVFFHQRQGPGQQSLFHVLRAYSALDKQVGYVQGMGFVSAILLMYMNEEAAFWTLVALLKGTASQPPLEGLYQAGMPLLQQCLFQFHELLKQEHPRLGLHLEQEGVVPSMYCTHWFNTLFAYSLPFEQLLRVWDVFLLEGMKVVFRVGIALLASAQDQLCHMPFERLVAALNGRKFPILNKQPDSLIKAAMRIPVSKQLEQLRERFLALQAETQAAAAAASTDGASAAADSGNAAAFRPSGTGRSGSSPSRKQSAAHAQQQLIAGFAPVPMGPNN